MAVHIEESFVEREERLLLKAILVWIKMRFITPLHVKLEESDTPAISIISRLEGMSLFAVVSQRDAWIMEKNAKLFNNVGREFMKKTIPEKAYEVYGGVTFVANRAMNSVDVCLLPPTYKPQMQGVLPCTMFIQSDKSLVKAFKSKKETNHFDVIPFLKRQIQHFLTPEEESSILDNYNKFKIDPEVIKHRKHVEEVKKYEDKNLDAVLKMMADCEDINAVKLAVMIYNSVAKAYSHDPHTVMKIKFEGAPVPVNDFSQLFMLRYETDLEIIKAVLDGVILPDIKITCVPDKILFSTSSRTIPEGPTDPLDPLFVSNTNTVIVESEEAMSYYFDMCVGTLISQDDVQRVVDGFKLQEAITKAGEA